MSKTTDLTTSMRQYLEALDRFDVEEALDAFADDVFYSHPGHASAGDFQRQEVKGRAALRQTFVERGPRPVRHRITRLIADDGTVFVSGYVELDGTTMASFVSMGELDDDGRIRHYESYASSPPVGSALADEGVS